MIAFWTISLIGVLGRSNSAPWNYRIISPVPLSGSFSRLCDFPQKFSQS
jgi:hypothetical protein